MIKSVRYKPLKNIVLFNLFTILIFLTAPLNWRTDNIMVFLLLFIACQTSLVLGFIKGSFRIITNSNKIDKFIDAKLINRVFIFYSLTFLIKYAYLLRFYPYQISEMFNFLAIGVASPDLGYQLSLDQTRPYTIPWSIYFLISIVNQIFFIIGFLTWKSINNVKKNLFIIFLILELFFWFGRGTNFGIINLITTFIFASWITHNSLKQKSNNLKGIIIMSALVVLVISVFSYNLTNRRGGADVSLNDFDIGMASIDINHPTLKIVPDQVQDTYLYIMSYLSQGYYHTTLAMSLDYQPTFLFGNNPAALDLADLLTLKLKNDTYVSRLEIKGVDPEINWHSAYTWYASDFSFYGLPILFYALGFFFGSSWILAFKNRDLLSQVIFVIFCNMLLFLFANNNYLSTMFYSFIIIFPYWLCTRIYKIKIS